MISETTNQNLISDEIKNLNAIPIDNQIEEINKLRKNLDRSIRKANNMPDPDDILYNNINRANKFLDKLEECIYEDSKENESTDEPDPFEDLLGKDVSNKNNNKKYISRWMEVATGLINSITVATSSIAGNFNAEQDALYKLQVLELKNKELEIKSIVAKNKRFLTGGNNTEGSGDTINNNLIIADREHILEIIKGEQEKEMP